MSLKDIIGEIDEQDNIGNNENIAISTLISFQEICNKNGERNPFKEHKSKKLKKLIESIKIMGILNPIILWKIDNQLIILSGHNRVNALKELGYMELTKEMYKIEDNIKEEQAKLILVDTNLCQRTDILPSEKAFSYKMKYDAIKNQGKRNDLTLPPNGQRLRCNSGEVIAKEVGQSRNQIQRYIRLTYLIEKFLDLVDKSSKNLPLRAAVEISYLNKNEQELLLEKINDEKVIPSHKQAIRLKEHSKQNELTKQAIDVILEKNITEEKFTININKLYNFFPKDSTKKEIEKTILMLLKNWNENNSFKGGDAEEEIKEEVVEVEKNERSENYF